MKLAEFGLESGWGMETRLPFRLQTKCMTSMWARILPRVETKDCWKILIECVPEVKDTRILNLLGAYTVECRCDVPSFLAETSSERKCRWISDVIHESATRVAAAHGWDVAAFAATHRDIERAHFVNLWHWRKPLRSPSRKMFAEIACHHRLDAMVLTLNIRAYSPESAQDPPLATAHIEADTGELGYARLLGRLRWDDARRASLYGKDGARVLTASVR